MNGFERRGTSEDDKLSSFRFMLTEERREQSLLRPQRSSMDTDEQLLQYLNNRRSSELEECDDYLRQKGLIPEKEEVVKVEERSQLAQQLLNKKTDEYSKPNQPLDLQVQEEEDYLPPQSPTKFCWEEVPAKKEENSSDNAIPTKFFVQLKSDDKPPIYRNINIAYEFKSRLKKGNYTLVNRYFSRIQKRDVAIKIIPKIGIDNKRLFKFVPRELDLAEDKKFKHTNIVKFLEIYEIGLRIYIMMEYVDKGNLSEYIKTRGRLDPVTYQSFFRQLINAVNYCLGYGICHRKLSTDNCLVRSDLVLKLCDFSYCRQIKDRNQLLETYCGVLGFTAPEILMCRNYRPNMTESWSCGVILFTMIYGAMPFDSSNFARLLKQVLKPIKYQWYCDTPVDAIIIMYQAMSPIGRRWSIQQILVHQWVTPPSTKGYENYMKWYKKRMKGPSVPLVIKKLIELREQINRDYVTSLNEKQEKKNQRTEEEASEQEYPTGKILKERKKLCELMLK